MVFKLGWLTGLRLERRKDATITFKLFIQQRSGYMGEKYEVDGQATSGLWFCENIPAKGLVYRLLISLDNAALIRFNLYLSQFWFPYVFFWVLSFSLLHVFYF